MSIVAHFHTWGGVLHVLFYILCPSLLLVFAIFYILRKFNKDGNECFINVWIVFGYFLLLFYGCQYFLEFDKFEKRMLIVWLTILFVLNLNRNYICKNIFLSMIVVDILLISMLHKQYDDYYKDKLQLIDFYRPRYVINDNLIMSQKRNVIVIFAESLNEEFAVVDKNYFIDDKDALKFTSFVEGFVQNWTQGALFSAFTGTHIHYVSDYWRGGFQPTSLQNLTKQRDRYASDNGDKFDWNTPNIDSIGKILSKQGYQNLFVKGGYLSFAGTDKFLLHNGFRAENIYGAEKIAAYYNKTISESIPSSWIGYPDKTTFDFFKLKIAELDKTKPFFAVMFTLDLHVGKNPYFKNFDEMHRDTIKNINSFIHWFKKQKCYVNTTLVIVGDHNQMGSNINPKGGIYNAFFNLPRKIKTQNFTHNRKFNQIDMFPTLLEIAGIVLQNRKAGIGVSIFADIPTLAEEMTIAQQEKMLNYTDKFYLSLWKK